MYITYTYTINDNNINIYFVEDSLKGFSTEIFSKVIKGRQHRRIVITDKQEFSAKPNKRKKITIDLESDFVLIVEEKSIYYKIYELYIVDKKEFKDFSLPKNYIVKDVVVEKIKQLLEEKNKYNEKLSEYEKLPQGVRNCYPMEEISQLYDIISENTWYRNQKDRLAAVPFVLDSPNAIRWLLKLGIVNVPKNIEDANSLVIFISLRLTTCLTEYDKAVAEKLLKSLIPKGEEKQYLYNIS